MSHLTPTFILSLPRSGSTLLQRLLSGHGQIGTVSEPAILLPMLYGLRDSGVAAEYGHGYYHTALRDLIQELPTGRAGYLGAVRRYALDLYAQAGGDQVTHFVDKTPRYALVARELIEAFPNGKFIFLWRNPLSVLASITHTWGKGRWLSWAYKADLYRGFDGLWAAFKESDRAVSLRYEDLVADPAGQSARVLREIGLPWDDGVLSGSGASRLRGVMGDPRGSIPGRVDGAGTERWRETLSNPLRRLWARRYLKWLGDDRIKGIGYDPDQLKSELQAESWNLRNLVGDLTRAAYGELNSALQLSLIWRSHRRARSRADLIRYN